MNSQPKFSILPLPGDDWETRRTKAIIRNMVRIKDMQGFTTQQLVDRCNAFLCEEDKIKLATLNGLFAGKRKSVTVTELEMFASALDVPLLALLYPPQEQEVEVRPGIVATAEYGIRHAAAIWSYYDGESPLDLERSYESQHDNVSMGVFRIINAWFMRWEFYDAMLPLFSAIEEGAANETLMHLRNAAMPAIGRLHHARKSLRELGVEPEALPTFYAWVDSEDPFSFSIDAARAYLPMFQQSREKFSSQDSDATRIKRKWLTELREGRVQNGKTA